MTTRSPSQIRLVRQDTEAEVIDRRRADSTRISVEWVLTGDSVPVEFQWSGPLHFLALHDITIQDGETDLNGVRAAGAADLRDTLTFVPAGVQVKGWSQNAPRKNGFTGIYFDPSGVTHELAEVFAIGRPAASLYFRDPGLSATVDKIRHSLTIPFGADPLYLDALGVVMTIELARALSSEPQIGVLRGGLSANQLRNVTEAIEAGLGQPLTLQTLADIAGLSRFHFLRAFKKSTGLSPHQFVLQRRLSKARDLLANTGLPLADIARATGFGSAAHFSRAFTQATGVAPSVFRHNT